MDLFSRKVVGWAAGPSIAREPARKERGHSWPVFLPDGQHVLYYGSDPGGGAVYVASLDTGSTTRLMASDAAAQYSSGYLLYVVGAELVARAFDPASNALGADQVSIRRSAISRGSSRRTLRS